LASVVASMTGFARASGDAETCTWVWELKSLNSRALDLRLRLPLGFDRLEISARARLSRRVTRGHVTAQLRLAWPEGRRQLAVNRDFVEQVLGLHRRLAGRVDPAPPRLDTMLSIAPN